MKHLSHQKIRHFLRHFAQLSFLRPGKQLHAVLTTSGLKNTPKSYLSNALFQFYANSGDIVTAHKLFDEIPLSEKDNVDWTALLSSYSRNGFLVNSMNLFVEMRRNRVEIDDVSLVCVFGVCSKLEDVRFGEQVHGFALRIGFLTSVKVCNALMDIYGKCGFVCEVKRIFETLEEKSVVSWTVLMDTVLKWEGLERGREVFDEMPERNVVAWTVMVVGYLGGGFTEQALELVEEMVFGFGYDLNFVTLCSMLSACAQSGNLVVGKWVHVYALKKEMIVEEVMVGTSLVDMYAKCGNIDYSYKVFKSMQTRNVVTWNAMFSGLAMHGKGRLVIDMFTEMVKEVKPDKLTFTAVLSACSHSGMVEKGWECFNSIRFYGLEPKVDHYACVVDLLGRTGHIEEAEIFIKKMPMPPNEVVLSSLLGSCSVHGKMEIAERIKTELVRTSPESHILISNMYVAEGRTEVADELRGSMRSRGFKKTPGASFVLS